jgi:hypothetical protein
MDRSEASSLSIESMLASRDSSFRSEIVILTWSFSRRSIRSFTDPISGKSGCSLGVNLTTFSWRSVICLSRSASRFFRSSTAFRALMSSSAPYGDFPGVADVASDGDFPGVAGLPSDDDFRDSDASGFAVYFSYPHAPSTPQTRERMPEPKRIPQLGGRDWAGVSGGGCAAAADVGASRRDSDILAGFSVVVAVVTAWGSALARRLGSCCSVSGAMERSP